MYTNNQANLPYQIGINNNGDLSIYQNIIFQNLKEVNILLLRKLLPTDIGLMQKLVQNKDKIILHYIVSGYGSSPLEKNVPHPAIAYKALVELLHMGFPLKNVVLRVDPIIPSEDGLKVFGMVLKVFQTLNIKRCRYRYLIQNTNVKNRAEFNQIFGQLVDNPYFSDVYNKTFVYAAEFQRRMTNYIIKQWEWHYQFESCARLDSTDGIHNVSCVSFFDVNMILNKPYHRPLPCYTRKNKCKCPINTVELVPVENTQCGLKCGHCQYKTTYI